MTTADLMHAIYENRKVAFEFYKFTPDSVGQDRDAARKALLESDAALRVLLAALEAAQGKCQPELQDERRFIQSARNYWKDA